MFDRGIASHSLLKAGTRLGRQVGTVALVDNDRVFGVLLTSADAIMLHTGFYGSMKRAGLRKIYERHFKGHATYLCSPPDKDELFKISKDEDGIFDPVSVIDAKQKARYVIFPTDFINIAEFKIRMMSRAIFASYFHRFV